MKKSKRNLSLSLCLTMGVLSLAAGSYVFADDASTASNSNQDTMQNDAMNAKKDAESAKDNANQAMEKAKKSGDQAGQSAAENTKDSAQNTANQAQSTADQAKNANSGQ
jgi:ElaB/YqjD/DUF883 family membrane-anchored ribosome-binding protein